MRSTTFLGTFLPIALALSFLPATAHAERLTAAALDPSDLPQGLVLRGSRGFLSTGGRFYELDLASKNVTRVLKDRFQFFEPQQMTATETVGRAEGGIARYDGATVSNVSLAPLGLSTIEYIPDWLPDGDEAIVSARGRAAGDAPTTVRYVLFRYHGGAVTRLAEKVFTSGAATAYASVLGRIGKGYAWHVRGPEGSEVWATDGVAAPQPVLSSPLVYLQGLFSTASRVVYTERASDQATGANHVVSFDGSTRTVLPFLDLGAPLGSDPVMAQGRGYCILADRQRERFLVASDGTVAGTMRFPMGQGTNHLVAGSKTLYSLSAIYTPKPGGFDHSTWSVRTTSLAAPAAPVTVKEWPIGGTSGTVEALGALGDVAYFRVGSEKGFELLRTDGTATGTTTLKTDPAFEQVRVGSDGKVMAVAGKGAVYFIEPDELPRGDGGVDSPDGGGDRDSLPNPPTAAPGSSDASSGERQGDGGCGCSVQGGDGASSRSPVAALAVPLLALLFARRRTRA